MVPAARLLTHVLLALLLALSGVAQSQASARMIARAGTMVIELCADGEARRIRLTPDGRELPAETCAQPCLACLAPVFASGPRAADAPEPSDAALVVEAAPATPSAHKRLRFQRLPRGPPSEA
jgi:hypothetical protein